MVVAVQSMSLSVLLPEITNDFNLSIVQAGILWGIVALPSIFSSILAGSLIDRFGTKRIMIIAVFLVGILGAARGLAQNYYGLLLTILLFGFFAPFVSISNFKNIGAKFEDHELGIANGALALGMASGFFLGSMISASYISPWIGGWQKTFILFGLIAIVFVIPWFFIRTETEGEETSHSVSSQPSTRENIKHVSGIKNIWLLGLAILCINGAVQGFLGYLPLYLRGLGWQTITADSLAASFHLSSMIFVIPITLISDKLGIRKKIALRLTIISTLGIGLVAVLNSSNLWIAVLIGGFARDGIMAILFTMVLKIKGIGTTYAGSAAGLLLILSGVGSLISPPLGNNLVRIAPNIPFVFWASLAFIGVICIASLSESQMIRGKNQTSDIANNDVIV